MVAQIEKVLNRVACQNHIIALIIALIALSASQVIYAHMLAAAERTEQEPFVPARWGRSQIARRKCI